MSGRLVVAVGTLGAAVMVSSWGLAYDEEHEVTRQPCGLTTGPAKVRRVRDQTCDKHGACEETDVVTLTSARRKRLLRFEGAAEITCQDRTVRLSLGAGVQRASVALSYLDGEERLTFDAGELRALEHRWSQPPGPVAPNRDNVIALYEMLTSLDRRPLLWATLLGAREALAAGDWAAAERYSSAASEQGAAKVPPLAARQREVADRLRSLRQQSPALLLGEWRRIGRLLTEPVSPPDSEASWFWRGRNLCVQQDADGSGQREPFMRCYDAGARRWSERAALARGPVDEAPKVTWHLGANVCDFENGWTVEGMNLGAAGICGYDFFPNDLFVVAKGPVALAAGDHGFQLIRPGPKAGQSQASPADRAIVRKVLATSGGSRLVADGDFFFDDESCTLYQRGDTRKTWLPLEKNGKGQAWRPLCPPLVAPDQTALAVAARRGVAPGPEADVIDLWWIQISGDGAQGHD